MELVTLVLDVALLEAELSSARIHLIEDTLAAWNAVDTSLLSLRQLGHMPVPTEHV